MKQLQLLSGVQISGDTAAKYCAMSKSEKVEFIVRHCEVDEQTAKEFVEKPLKQMDGKACCGGYHKTESHEHDKSGIVQIKTDKPAPVGKNTGKK